MPTRTSVAVLLVGALVLSVVAQPVAGTGGVLGADEPQAVQQTENGEEVSVGVGQQLSTVITTTSVRTGSAVSADLFDQAFENATEEEQANAVIARGETLEANAVELTGEFENATAAYRSGDLSTSEYAQRLATFNARANTIEESAATLIDRAANVSDLELRAAGYNETELQAAIDDVDSLTGIGLATVYQRFTGEVDSNVSLSTTDGLSVTAEADGELAREFEREGDDDSSYTVSQSVALETARGTLTALQEGTWRLVDADVRYEYGTYRFEFELLDQGRSGEAKAIIDGSSGEILRFEEEIEREDSDENDVEDEESDDDHESEATDEDEHSDEGEADHQNEGGDDDESEVHDDDDESELALLVTEGTIGPNETVTLQALRNGSPAPNVTIEVNDEVVGETDDNGTLLVRLPDHETEIDGGEASLDFEFENRARESREVFERLSADGTLSGDTLTVAVEYDNQTVANATVWVNDRQVGRTAADGTLSFDVGNESELDVEIVKGEFEAELEYERMDGRLRLTEAAHEGDGDKVESDDDADEEDDAEETEDDEHEEDDEEDEEDVAEETEDDEHEEDDGDGDHLDETDEEDDDAGETEDDDDEVDEIEESMDEKVVSDDELEDVDSGE